MNQRFFIKGFMLAIFSLAQASILTPSATLAAPGVGSVPLPQLSHSVSPLSYGAKGDGVNDDTAAFQAAVNADDVLIPPGTYKISGQVLVPSNRNIQCQRLATVLINPQTHTDGNAIFVIRGSQNWSISNCTLQGTNTSTPPGYDAVHEWNFLIAVVAEVGSPNTQGLVTGNIFKNSWANSALSVYGNDITGPYSDITVAGNEFYNCGHYGVSLTSAVNSHISLNKAVDCSMANEVDDLGQRNSGNVWDHNYVGKVKGSGWGQTAQGDTLLSCGTANGFDYSGNTCEYNTIDGAVLYESTSRVSYQGLYIENQCINGCLIK
jgi:polygalacturonase